MKEDHILQTLDRIHSLEQVRNSASLQKAIQSLGSAIRVGDISGSSGVAIGNNIRMVINHLNLPAEIVADLIDIRHLLGSAQLALDPDRYRSETFITEKAGEFIGRNYVFSELDNFLRTQKKGYFIIEGEPGVGKSSIMAEIVRRTGCISHFNERTKGINSTEKFLESICSQIIVDAGLSYASLPNYATRDGAFLDQLLQQASSKLNAGEQLLLVVDALDEVDTGNTALGANILYLPRILPGGVFFVLSRRSVDLPFVVEAPSTTLNLSDHPDDNRTDIEAYITKATESKKLRNWIRSQSMDDQQLTEPLFITWLADLSENNFMYLRYVLPEIENGSYRDRDIRTLPKGLMSYYHDHWSQMGMMVQPLPELKILTVYILCEARQPISIEMILGILKHNHFEISPLILQGILDEWSQFFHIQPAFDFPRYSLYHSSFQDFLHQQKIVQAAKLSIKDIHSLIANYMWDDLFSDDEYKQ